MPLLDHLGSGRRSSVLRALGFALAVALGAVAVWLIVTGTADSKRIEIGVLAGLWGLLLGAFSAFGSRRDALRAAPPPAVAPDQARDVAVRGSSDLDRAQEAAARRAFEARLEQMLRHEINSTMSREVSDLRAEIAALRQDLLEKVGGQLRLERIETTRLIGSDLEAMRDEVRRLKLASEAADHPMIGSGRPLAVSPPVHTIVEAVSLPNPPVQPPPIAPPESPPPPPVQPRSLPVPPPPIRQNGTQPPNGTRTTNAVTPVNGTRGANGSASSNGAAASPPPPTGPPVAPPPATSPPASNGGSMSADPFAGLPRLSPFTDDESDPERPTAPPTESPVSGTSAGGPSGDGYSGRRRRSDGGEAASDLLARLLARESGNNS